MKPISVQLYSLREECAEDFDAVLERLAAGRDAPLGVRVHGG